MFGLRLTDRRKGYFLIFQNSIDYCQIIIIDFKGFYYVTNIFDLHIFNSETAALLNFFEICAYMHFVSLSFLSKRNITTSSFNDTFKMYCCTLR